MTTLILESIESYNQYIDRLPSGCLKISELIRSDEIREALTMILDFGEGVTWLNEMNELIKKSGYTVHLEISKIHEYLNEINEALSIQDFIIVADMFEYEIAPFFETVEKIQ